MRLAYRPQLDGVRALAIILVVGFHAFGVPVGGYFGVDVFFVLSGYLITSLLTRELPATRTFSLAGFYRRRAARLLPALFVMLAVFLIFRVRDGDPSLIGRDVVGALAGAFYCPTSSRRTHRRSRSPTAGRPQLTPTMRRGRGSTGCSSAASSGSSQRRAVSRGRISYSLYLWHVPVLVGLQVSGEFGENLPGAFAGVGLSLVAAALSYSLVEVPARRWLRGTSPRPWLQPAPT